MNTEANSDINLPAALTNTELIALLLNGDTQLAEDLLTQYGSLRGLAQALSNRSDPNHRQLQAALELGKRLMTYAPEDRPQVRQADDAARLIMDMRLLPQEHVRAILLDLNQNVIAIPTLYIGTLSATVLRVAEIFRAVMAHNCPAFILVHNHPAGDSSPSPEDIELTRTLIEAGRLLDITVIDHLIIGQNGWVSIKELGLAF